MATLRFSRLVGCAIFLIGVLAAAYGSRRLVVTLPAGAEPPALSVHFLDVGQGDAVLIQIADGRAVLYDGGDGCPSIIPLLEHFAVDSIELVIASHNHADHIGGLDDVIERFRPRYVMENGVAHTTLAYERLLRAAHVVSAQSIAPTLRTINLGDVKLHVIPPSGAQHWGHNDNSLGIIVELGEFRVSLLGDSEQKLQSWWLERHGDLLDGVTVHKASHHGSDSGDTSPMIERLRPAIVVIGAGARNSYGHPHAAALRQYDAVGAQVYSTAQHGTVSVTVDNEGRVDVRTQHGARR